MSRALRALFLTVAIVASFWSIWKFTAASWGGLLMDFKIFYCSARVWSAGADPYTQEPLYTCEAAPLSSFTLRTHGDVALPSPLAPYEIAAFVPLTWVPFTIAAVVWTSILCAAYVVIAVALRELTGASWIILCACLLPAAVMALSLGQIAPLAIAALCGGALLLRRGQHVMASLAVLGVMLEPHIGIPAIVGLYCGVKRSRLALAIAFLALIVFTLFLQPALSAEFAFRALPALGESDLRAVSQFSLSVLLHAIGANDKTALLIGSIWYVTLAVAGVVLALVAARRNRDPALLILIPTAFAVFGGSYVHLPQVAAAVPALLILMKHNPESELSRTALVLLSVPWLFVIGWGMLIPLGVAVTAVLTWQLWKPPAAVLGAISCLCFVVVLKLNHTLTPSAAVPFQARVAAAQMAAVSWGQYVDARLSIDHGVFLWAHAPTWLALGMLIVASAKVAFATTRHRLAEQPCSAILK
jgi:hypothetical protein